MQFGGGIGYTGFVVAMLVITGILTLRIDMKRYQEAGMHREHKAARFIGWLNVAAGVMLFAGNWLYHKLV